VRRRALLAAGAAALLAAPAARAENAQVVIPGKVFDPAQVTIVAGDGVTWRNADFDQHDVRGAGGEFQSGRIARFGAFNHVFGAAGSYPYLCTIHPVMTGKVDVVAALLSGPAEEVVAGEPVVLEGRAGAGTPSVSIEAGAADNSWHAVTAAAPGPGGAFSATVRPEEPTTYRAVTPAGASPPVAVRVTSNVMLHVHVHPRKQGRHRHVRVDTEPARPGLEAAIYRWDRWRYDWKRKGHATLDAEGRAGFRMTRRKGLVMVQLYRPSTGAVLGTSEPVRLKDGRTAEDPTPGVQPGGHGGGAPH
jgi:plastocyanin